MKTKKVVKMPLRRRPTGSKTSRSRPAAQRARTAAAADDYDYEGAEEPNMKFTHALIVVLVLHLVAVGGVLAFNWMKARQGDQVKMSSSAESAPAPAVTAKSAAPESVALPPVAESWTGQTHTVAAGDTLTRIAEKYNLTLAALEEANGIDTYTMIRVGQELKIPEAKAPAATRKTATNPPKAQPAPDTSAKKAFLATQAPVTTKKAVIAAVPTNRVGQTAPSTAESAPVPAGETYVVVKGDNPYSIARKFKVSYNDLIEINGISDPTKIQIGQTLKIPGK